MENVVGSVKLAESGKPPLALDMKSDIGNGFLNAYITATNNSTLSYFGSPR